MTACLHSCLHVYTRASLPAFPPIGQPARPPIVAEPTDRAQPLLQHAFATNVRAVSRFPACTPGHQRPRTRRCVALRSVVDPVRRGPVRRGKGAENLSPHVVVTEWVCSLATYKLQNVISLLRHQGGGPSAGQVRLHMVPHRSPQGCVSIDSPHPPPTSAAEPQSRGSTPARWGPPHSTQGGAGRERRKGAPGASHRAALPGSSSDNPLVL